MVASERDRPDIARRREQWAKYQGRIEPERLVFIDETWTKTNMAPLRGWSLCGTRLTAKVPHGRWRTTTFVAALRHDRITAPWVLDGPIDRSEPHRTGLCQTQTPATKVCRANNRSRLRSNRPAPPSLHTTGMRELLQKRRICLNLISSRSSELS